MGILLAPIFCFSFSPPGTRKQNRHQLTGASSVTMPETNARRKSAQVSKLANYHIQLFQDRLSEKVQATIPKGIVGDFEFTVFQRNFKELHEKPWTYVSRAKRKQQR